MSRAARKTAEPVDQDQPLLPIIAPQRQRSRDGKKAITGRFDPPVARAVAVLAVKEDRTVEDLMREAVGDLLAKYNQELIGR
jgi:hypothetical protein